MRILVYTAGGSPNTAQRARRNALLGDRNIPQAVVTASALARAAGTAISWFQPTFRLFAPDQLEKALDHLAVPGGARLRLRRAI
jgi:hypothetical protein